MKQVERSALFAQARRAGDPTSDDRQRVRAALGRKLGVAAGAAVAATTSKAAGLAGVGAVAGLGGATAAVVKVAAVVVALAVFGVGAVVMSERTQGRSAVGPVELAVRPAPIERSAADPATPELHAPPVPVTPPSVSLAPTRAPSPVALLAPTAAPVPGATDTPSASILPDRTAEELALIQQMQTALRAGDTARTLAIVAEHERRFPDGQLAPEREGAKVIALCTGAPRDRAAELGRAFLASHARSPVAARVRATCGFVGTNDFETGPGTGGQ